MSQQLRPNAQPNGQYTTLVQHANEITSIAQRWQSTTLGYYIPRNTIPTWSTLVVGYYTSEPIPILNPTVVDLELERNQLLNQLEQLKNLNKDLHTNLIFNSM